MKLRKYLLVALLLLLSGSSFAEPWILTGPEGGEVRSLASDPQNPDRIFLGTSSGTIYLSTDSGRSWALFARPGHNDDYVIDHIAVAPRDPRRIYVAVWRLADRLGGDFFFSLDGGKSWQTAAQMHGKSIRSMAISASQPGLVVVGALDGVFRSRNGGLNWKKISGSRAQIRNVESIAIDPTNPDVIYAGTWHLAWKTINGGLAWRRVDEGIIDDSDVFSILIDVSNPLNIFAGACSGIYKSQNGADLFQRILSVPFSARRTRVLRQDPTNPAVLYAGTTEGLWVSTDLGEGWKRVTSPQVVINDVLINSRNGRVLLATDRAGILVSDNAPLNFLPSNSGFVHRYISSVLVDQGDPEKIYVGVVNDRDFGGVFISNDGGIHWLQRSDGLKGRDVFVLNQTADGTILAGTNQGLLSLSRNASIWRPVGNLPQQQLGPGAAKDSVGFGLAGKVNSVEITPNEWLVATSAGLYVSMDQGHTWKQSPVPARRDIFFVRARGDLIVLAVRSGLLISKDNGKHWRRSKGMPSRISNVRSLLITTNGDVMVASQEGVFRTGKAGASWRRLQGGLPALVTALAYDDSKKRLLAIAEGRTSIFASYDGGLSWYRGPDTRVPLRKLAIAGGRILAASRFDGMILEARDQNENLAHSRQSK